MPWLEETREVTWQEPRGVARWFWAEIRRKRRSRDIAEGVRKDARRRAQTQFAVNRRVSRGRSESSELRSREGGKGESALPGAVPCILQAESVTKSINK